MPGNLRLLWEQGLAPRTFLGAFDKSAVTALSRNLGGGVDAAAESVHRPLCLHNHLEFSPGTRSRILTPLCWLQQPKHGIWDPFRDS